MNMGNVRLKECSESNSLKKKIEKSVNGFRNKNKGREKKIMKQTKIGRCFNVSSGVSDRPLAF